MCMKSQLRILFYYLSVVDIENSGKLSQVLKGMIFIVYYSLITELGATVISGRYPKVHASNGQEYARVYIDHDVAASLSRPGGVSVNQFGDEANIGHVAFMRAMRDLFLDLKRLISGSKKRL